MYLLVHLVESYRGASRHLALCLAAIEPPSSISDRARRICIPLLPSFRAIRQGRRLAGPVTVTHRIVTDLADCRDSSAIRNDESASAHPRAKVASKVRNVRVRALQACSLSTFEGREIRSALNLSRGFHHLDPRRRARAIRAFLPRICVRRGCKSSRWNR